MAVTNFEKATRNTLLWRVPGQAAVSQGRNSRYVEMLDFFPTVVELMGLPHIPECTGFDQPPSVLCLQVRLGEQRCGLHPTTASLPTHTPHDPVRVRGLSLIAASAAAQGASYADEFIPALAKTRGGGGAVAGRQQLSTPKSYIFSQWPFPARASPGETGMRMSYTVRTDAGYRMTQYVPYNLTDHTVSAAAMPPPLSAASCYCHSRSTDVITADRNHARM
jgi:hypothetical protein